MCKHIGGYTDFSLIVGSDYSYYISPPVTPVNCCIHQVKLQRFPLIAGTIPSAGLACCVSASPFCAHIIIFWAWRLFLLPRPWEYPGKAWPRHQMSSIYIYVCTPGTTVRTVLFYFFPPIHLLRLFALLLQLDPLRNSDLGSNSRHPFPRPPPRPTTRTVHAVILIARKVHHFLPSPTRDESC